EWSEISQQVEAKDAPPSVFMDSEEEFYQAVILNYPSARHWREKPRIPTGLPKLNSSGDWYKIVIRKEGMYKVTGSLLSAAGIDISTIDPKTIRLYNNGGRELPRSLTTSRPDSLIENAILMVDGGDGKLDASDYFVFYGKGLDGWDYNPVTGRFFHYINHYTYDNIYWLTWGGTRPGKRMAEKASLSGTDRDVYTSSTEHVFLEQELNNIFSSGLDWYGPQFSRATTTRTFTINLPGAVSADRASFNFRLIGATSGNHRFYAYVNGNLLASWYFSDIAERQFSITQYGVVKEGINTIELQYQASSDIMSAYLDWIEVEYIRRLQAQNGLLFFKAPFSPRPAKYEISGFNPNQVEIFDLSDFSNVKRLTGISSSDNQISFVDSSATTTPKRYLAINPSLYELPKSIIKSKKNVLRNPELEADFIIITHEDFYDQARRLQRHRQDRDNLKTIVVNISDIYDEFSWGLFDPTAIRDFLHYAFFNYRVTPSYVLLFGDGDYDYKNLTGTSDKNWLPPYETTEFNSTDTRATDDWYTFVNGPDQFMDLAIGRLPVRSLEEARNAVDKIIAYETNPLYGDWKNTITIVGDDELAQGGAGNETFHIIDSEDLAEHYVPKEFDIKKIYLTEYPAVKSAAISGVSKPAAAEALLEQVNRGTLMVNFIGHGNEKVLTHERIFTLSESLGQLQNDRKWPFWVAATCAFGRYDIPQEQSLSEILLTTADRGVIALLASSREAFADPNADLNKIFYQKLFYQKGETRRLGQALMFAKLITYYPVNDQKYHILGDPTLKLAVPHHRVIIDSVEPGSIQALSTIKVTGHVEGQARPDLGGKIFLKAFDSKRRKTYLTELGSSLKYWLPGNAIFRGTSSLQNGAFEIQFIVPKDITYGGNLGRLSVYYWDGTSDGAGYQDSLQVGGTATGIVDVTGPDIIIG
ncbi:MAG: type IX secretion system sortase PorU, partial [candidate division KSB1 bacterium]|nr:type IX secretion system sortase PorU [candidate division KSB1 bacterium]